MSGNSRSENAAGKGLRYLKERGLKEFAAHAAEKVQEKRFDYQVWIRRQEISAMQAGYQRKRILPFMPKIHVMILTPDAGGTKESGYRQTRKCVEESTYPNVFLAEAMTSMIGDEDYIAFVPEGDLIARNAFYEAVCALQDKADALYTDEDSFRKEGDSLVYSDPLFKPQYDPDYLRSFNYIGHLFVVRAGIVRSFYREENAGAAPTPEKLSEPAFYYRLVLRCTQRAAEGRGVVRVPKVLCHTMPSGSSAPETGVSSVQADSSETGAASGQAKAAEPDDSSGRTGSAETGVSSVQADSLTVRDVLEEDLALRGLKGIVEDGPLPETFHIRYEVEGEPLVSIVIPNKDNMSVLENCIWSLRHRSTYRNFEIIVVENNSVEKATFDYYRKIEESGEARVVWYPEKFHFSRVINEGVRHAKGDYLILMNNDVTVLTPDWIERLLSQVSRPGIGAAGPKLLFPDGRVQSAGIVVGMMGFAGSMMVAEDGNDPGYMGRACLTQQMSAVTAACMMVKRSAFVRAGGFPDEFEVALGDVDFCLSLKDIGEKIILEPSVRMIHHESLTRGMEDSKEKKKRFASEIARFKKKRRAVLRDGDPAYNPNLSSRRCDWSQQI